MDTATSFEGEQAAYRIEAGTALARVTGVFVPAFPPVAAFRTLERRRWRTDRLFPGARLFARGRHALHTGLAALAEVHGVRRLWLPAYICRPVADAAAAAGLRAALYDIDERLHPRWSTVNPAPGDALLVLHAFGLALPGEAVMRFCAAYRLPLVENCAHAVPDPEATVQVGSYGALAVFSLRKQAPLPGGGLLVLNDPALRDARPWPAPRGVGDRRTVGRLALMLLERAAVALDCNPLSLKDRLPVLDAHPVAHGTASPARADPPAEYARPPAPPAWLPPMVARLDWRPGARARLAAYEGLAIRLAAVPGIVVPVVAPPPGSVPLALPVWARQPDLLVRALRAAGVEAMRWPGREQIPFDRGALPGAAAWLDRTVLLPLGWAGGRSRLSALLDAVARAADAAVGASAAV